MKKIIEIVAIILGSIAYSQVGINTEEPNSNTLLHISEKLDPTDTSSEVQSKGIIIPRLTEEQRDGMTTTYLDNGLLIYNTTENSFNYWDSTKQEWRSLPAGEVPDKATFEDIDCSGIEVKGTYHVGDELTSSNYLIIPLNVKTDGEYTVIARTTNGYNFFTSGTFLDSGEYTLRVPGQGTPKHKQLNDVITISVNGIPCTATVNVRSIIPRKKVLHAEVTAGYGYSAWDQASRNMMDAPINFGTTDESKINTEGFDHYKRVNTASTLETALKAIDKPDIVIYGYGFSLTAAANNALVDYLNQGGVVILFAETTIVEDLMEKIFNNTAIGYQAHAPSGGLYQLSNDNDVILNGPFGDIRGKIWGDDGTGIYLSNLPAGDITAYSGSTALNTTTSYSAGVSMFKHNTLNLFWVGDGGFIASGNIESGIPTSNINNPFATNSDYKPVIRPSYGAAGNGYYLGSTNVVNSILFANVLAWALDRAEYNGINTTP
ncbi:MAG: hypothetical protein LBQ84_06690 [Flavobacteriaceae bacterium]|nr:hypothetical protein [Flavobacteriaceae bacterium]